jgi:hypothetical protein
VAALLCGPQHGGKPAGAREQFGGAVGHVAFLERGAMRPNIRVRSEAAPAAVHNSLAAPGPGEAETAPKLRRQRCDRRQAANRA